MGDLRRGASGASKPPFSWGFWWEMQVGLTGAGRGSYWPFGAAKARRRSVGPGIGLRKPCSSALSTVAF